MRAGAQPIEIWDDSRFDADVLKRSVKARLLGVSDEPPRLGPFALARCLGRGASGTVYEATDARDGSVVAVKLLRRADAEAIARFKAEFRGLTHVAHDNLARLHELFAQGDAWYFSMELVRGDSFTAHVRAAGACDVERLRCAMAQLLCAVHALHASGTLHRDLKPSNVLVTAEGRVVVIDFGLATAVGAAHRPALRAHGTPPYMAPELDARLAPSPASDAYAIGVMLFQALTGRLPWNGTPAEVTRRRREQNALQARALWPEAPEDLERVVRGVARARPARARDDQRCVAGARRVACRRQRGAQVHGAVDDVDVRLLSWRSGCGGCHGRSGRVARRARRRRRARRGRAARRSIRSRAR